MKVLLNISRPHFPVGEWVECAGFKLEEATDGSFDLFVTKDIEIARQNQRELEESRERIRSIFERGH